MKTRFYAFILMLAALLTGAEAMAQTGYRIGVGDQITVEVLQDSSLNRTVVVLPDGRISFPFAGTIQAAGRTVGQIEATITAGIAGQFTTEPNVFVSVQPAPEEPRVPRTPAPDPVISIYYIGEVATPGVREVPPGTTLLQALAQSGGFTDFAALKRVQLRRTDPDTGQYQMVEFNYRAVADGARILNDIELIDGDVILVPERRLFE